MRALRVSRQIALVEDGAASTCRVAARRIVVFQFRRVCTALHAVPDSAHTDQVGLSNIALPGCHTRSRGPQEPLPTVEQVGATTGTSPITHQNEESARNCVANRGAPSRKSGQHNQSGKE